jgi:Tol biopolymer transport system component
MELLVRDIGGGEPVLLLDSLGAVWDARWSDDSARIAVAGFRVIGHELYERHIFVIPRLGGSVRRLDPYLPIDWSPDGRRIAVCKGRWKKISFVDVATGKATEDSVKLDLPFTWIADMDWSPGGDRFLVRVHVEDGNEEIWTIGTHGDVDPKRVAKGRMLLAPRWSNAGESIYYVVPTGAVQSLWRVGVDKRSGESAGEPRLLMSGIAGLGERLVFSSGGSLTYARHLVDKDLWRISTSEAREAGETASTQLTRGTAMDDWPSISPDGRQIAFVRVTGEVSNVFTVPIDGGAARQVTFMDSPCQSPVWSPDGLEIAFCSYEEGTYKLWKVSAVGGAADVFENTSTEENSRIAWAPGMNILYYPTGVNSGLRILDPDTGDESWLVERAMARQVGTGFSGEAIISPDGSRVAVHWLRKSRGETGIWVISQEDSSHALVLKGHKHPFAWSRDGEWIYYYDAPPPIGRVRTDGSGDEIVFSLPFEEINPHPVLSMSPDGQYIVGGFEVKTPSDIWLVENFDPTIQR